MSDSIPITSGSRDDSAWLTSRRFALILGLFVIAAFPQIVFGRQTFVYRDFSYFGYPLAHYFRESFWHGEIPLWNPLNNCGIPFLAQWNTQVLYPPALFYLLLPLSWSLGVFCLLHLWLGGMGMFFLTRRWTGNNFAAAVAGIVFAFNGLMLNSLMWPSTIPGLAWMPWVVWLVEKSWRDGGKALVIAAIVGALQMLSGAAEVIMLTWVLVGAIAVGEFFFNTSARWKIVLRFGIVVLLITGLCAAQLLPFLELLKNSNRQSNFDTALWAMPVSGLGNFLAPLFHCENPYGGVFLQHNQYWTGSYYVGVTTIALALVTLWRPRSWRVWLLGALLTLCLLLAVGNATPIYKWATRAISVLSVMRFPVKFVILPVFILPLLAAFAVAQQQTSETRRIYFGKSFWIVAGGVFVLLGEVALVAWRAPQPQDNTPATLRNAAMRAAFFVVTICLFVFSERISKLKLRRLMQFFVLSLLWLDLVTHMPFAPTVNPDVYKGDFQRETAKPVHGNSRAMIEGDARTILATSGVVDTVEDYMRRRRALFSDCNLLENIPKVDGFFPMYPRDHMEIFSLLFLETNLPSAGLLDFLGVSMVTSPTNLMGWVPRNNFLPMLSAGQKPIFADEKTTLRALSAKNFNPRTEVWLPVESRPQISVTNQSRVAIKTTHVSAQRIEAEVEASASSVIVAAQTFYPAWKVSVDGKPVKLWKANAAFQAFQVPAGKHQVKLIYSDGKFQFGAAISLATLLGCAVFWGWKSQCGTASLTPA